MDLSRFVSDSPTFRAFLAPNTSDNDIVDRSRSLLEKCGIPSDRIEVNYDIQLLEPGDIYASFDPPDLVVRLVYEKKKSGLVKMKSIAMMKL